MSNYEYLRSLPPEELAKEIVSLPICSICALNKNWDCNKNDCIAAAVEWLKFKKETR